MSMDQSCSSSRTTATRPAELIQPPSIYDFGYPRPEQHISSPVAYNLVSNTHSFSYSRYGNDNSTQEIGWDQGDLENQDNRPYMLRWKSGKKVDQRLLMVLESYFQEIYVKREDFFKKIFPEMYDEFADVFSRVGAMLWKNKDEKKCQTLQRSLSVGSPPRPAERFKVRTPAVVIGSPRRPERFKVRTPAAVIGNLDGQGGKTTSTNN